MGKDEMKISLEQYRHFCEHSRWRGFDLSRPHLNQIIGMHGFSRLHNQPKSLLLECLDSIDLMPPSRSTLEETISSCAVLDAGEVSADLEALGWQECVVRFVQTLGSEAEQTSPAWADASPATASTAVSSRRRRRLFRAPPATFVVAGRRPRSKRKRISINALTQAATSSTAVAVAVFPPLPLSPRPETPPPPSSPPPPFLWF